MHDINQIISNRIIGQYKDSPVIIAFIESLSNEFDFVHNEIKRVVTERYFNDAKNVNLDILGEIVGIKREVTDFVETDYFSFLQDPTGKGFDSLNEKVKAGRYRSADENAVTTRKLIDSEYRILIGAKILKNISNITPNDVLLITRKILSLMYPNITINITIVETGNASFQVKVNYILTPAEKSFIASLDLIPRPVGVKIEYVYEDIDIDLGINLNTILGDTVSKIDSSLINEGLISAQLSDSITSIVSNVESNISISVSLSDTVVSIQAAPPGTISFNIVMENSTTGIVSNVEIGVSVSVILDDLSSFIDSNIENKGSLVTLMSDTISSSEININNVIIENNQQLLLEDSTNLRIE